VLKNRTENKSHFPKAVAALFPAETKPHFLSCTRAVTKNENKRLCFLPPTPGWNQRTFFCLAREQWTRLKHRLFQCARATKPRRLSKMRLYFGTVFKHKTTEESQKIKPLFQQKSRGPCQA